MGGCLSLVRSDELQASASDAVATVKVISINGSLREYPVPVVVSQVLEVEEAVSNSSFFLCNSDRLYFDNYIPTLDLEDELEANQIYFILPASKLERRLSATDMAALAVRASLALQNASNNTKGADSHSRHRRNNKARISPLLTVNSKPRSDDHDIDYDITIAPSKKKNNIKAAPGLGISRSGSVRKFHKYTSRRAIKAVRSFKLRLTTIYEGTVL